MDLKQLETYSKKPSLYEKGNSVMWTDEYISKQLLGIHLNPELDLASRGQQSIDSTLEFILKLCSRSGLNILDLGCGPGLYAERLAEAGHHVTGVDFSESSIKYASDHARIKNLDIHYVCRDYLTLDYKDKFDVVLLVYTDFGVLIPSERDKLLAIIHKALKSGGLFIFDVINDNNLEQKFSEQKSWDVEPGGFWRDSTYLALINGFHYADEKVFLQQHIIVDQSEQIRTYRFWTHYFERADIFKILGNNGFTNIEGFDNVLPHTDIWNGDNITFYKTEKC
jgi:2-polyprenyl-3-methyl-5-hydroxy-6-metoxy-1,4-benzoquinol methylase